MSNTNGAGFLAILVIIAQVAAWLGSGYAAWNWVEPDSFGSGIVFIIAWGILGYVFQLILGLIVEGLASIME